MDANQLKAMQAPLKEKYRAAGITVDTSNPVDKKKFHQRDQNFGRNIWSNQGKAAIRGTIANGNSRNCRIFQSCFLIRSLVNLICTQSDTNYLIHLKILEANKDD